MQSVLWISALLRVENDVTETETMLLLCHQYNAEVYNIRCSEKVVFIGEKPFLFDGSEEESGESPLICLRFSGQKIDRTCLEYLHRIPNL